MTVTLTRKEAQQVLAVLDDLSPQHGRPDDVEESIETLRARLSAPEPEPYGYIARRNWKMPVFIEADNVEATGLPYDNADYEPVFKAPPQPEPPCKTGSQCIGGKCPQCVVSEPVAWMNEGDIGKTDWKVWAHGKPTATIPLYAAPPQRKEDS